MNIFKKITNELEVDTPLDKVIKEDPNPLDMDRLKGAMVVEVIKYIESKKAFQENLVGFFVSVLLLFLFLCS